MRMWSGSCKDKNSAENLWIEANELKSISNNIIWAIGVSFCINSFKISAFFKSLAGNTILTPLFANTLAVSDPIPDVAPVIFTKN